MLLALQGAVSQGILWGIMALGVLITYKLLDIPDLTVDGSFALGGCVCATLVVSGTDPWLALIGALLAGAAAGAVTGILHAVLEIPAILAGILTMIGLWSINLRVMGKSNTPLLRCATIFTRIQQVSGLSATAVAALVGIVLAVALIVALYWFFGTEIGSALRATGANEDMVRALGVNTRITKIIGLMLANGLVGLSGGLISQSQRYADIGMGTGAIVIGLAAIVIGEVLGRLGPGGLRAFGSRLIAAVAGSVAYFLVRAVVLQLGMNANDMKLLSAAIVVIALSVPVMVEKMQLKRRYRRACRLRGGER
ncbi:inner-membrane translocator [Coriobacterium glomerans PW2]|uniref:Inner-membrane translocator n=1 Tax=Coriobacterium glomerans (strain ATCC 49209 / DSM 20642 / JCM 10262 / PW2) TaxID=700015 RepID=F2N8T5_CORGP|nr:ABC transporter permease [Coriobacterium glomerans]AEB07468.1 inner-membrane translocator [Coriobacterium glomerans PW2]